MNHHNIMSIIHNLKTIKTPKNTMNCFQNVWKQLTKMKFRRCQNISNLGVNNGYFDARDESVDILFGEGKVKETDLTGYEMIEVFFDGETIKKTTSTANDMVYYVRGFLQFNLMGNCLEILKSLLKPSRTFNINGKRLKQIHQIAQGGYGYVLLVEDMDTKRRYALKKLICQTDQHKNNYKNEVSVMKTLSGCPHVIGYHGSYQITKNEYIEAYILMQLAKKTVLDLLTEVDAKNQNLTQAQILKILKDTALGLKEMHDLNVFHQDVKVENILITQDGTAKLCDLGSCSTQRINLQEVTKSQMYHHQERFEKNTTLMYRPPEMIDLYLKYPIDERVDIWMLGCVLYVLNYKYHPFQDEGKLSIVNAAIKYKSGYHCEKMGDLMRHMLTPNVYFRPKIDEILSIIDNWDHLDKIPLNKVAETIKYDEICISSGQYDKTSNGSWRSFKRQL